MRIKQVVWLRQFAEKIDRKHHVSQDEVEQLFLNRPTFSLPNSAMYRTKTCTGLLVKLTPIFDQYLRQAALPVLELKFGEGEVSYRWKADVKEFAMPIKVGAKSNWQIIQPTGEWKTMKTGLQKDQFEVATDLYYVDVSKS